MISDARDGNKGASTAGGKLQADAGYKGWKGRGRLFVASVRKKGEIAGNSSLKTAEQMGREA